MIPRAVVAATTALAAPRVHVAASPATPTNPIVPVAATIVPAQAMARAAINRATRATLVATAVAMSAPANPLFAPRPAMPPRLAPAAAASVFVLRQAIAP